MKPLRLTRRLLSGRRGIDTTVRGPDSEFLALWEQIVATADLLGLPDQWVLCPMCGSQSWRFPPHGIGEPCPIAKEMMDAAGMKLEAERSTAIRLGVGMEEAMKQVRRSFGEEDDDDE